MDIWKRVPNSKLRYYFGKGQPLLAVNRGLNPNYQTAPVSSFGLLIDVVQLDECVDELLQSTREIIAKHAESILPTSNADVELVSGDLTDMRRELLVRLWRTEFASASWEQPVFWACDYRLMEKVHGYYTG